MLRTAAAHGAHGGGGTDIEEEIDMYLDRPFFSLARHRVGWLTIFLASLSLTAIIMNGFEHTLSRQIELAYFVPLLAGHGGNTGGQTVGTVLAALSAGAITARDAPKVIIKESLSGLSMGATARSWCWNCSLLLYGHIVTRFYCYCADHPTPIGDSLQPGKWSSLPLYILGTRSDSYRRSCHDELC